MYSFFDQAGQRTQRLLAAAGSLIVAVVLMISAMLPAGVSTPTHTVYVTGVLA